jgi:tetratricopeptide (TPR) repeat protein
MRTAGALALLLVPAAVLFADDELLPPPRQAPAPIQPGVPAPPALPPRVLNLPPVPETPSTAPDLAALRLESQRLRAERDALAAERQSVGNPTPAESEEVAKLRRRLAELVATLNAKPLPRRTPLAEASQPAPRAGGGPRPETPAGAAVNPSDVPSGDPVLAARALFRAGDHAAALETYRQIDLNGLTRDERTLVQYMSACCLRKLGRLDEAAALYREVASAREDEVLTDCALWHLSAINWRRDMEKQLDGLRERRQNTR